MVGDIYLYQTPGGRDNARQVTTTSFSTFSLPHPDGNYFLRPDRILGAFRVDHSKTMVQDAKLSELNHEKNEDNNSVSMLKLNDMKLDGHLKLLSKTLEEQWRPEDSSSNKNKQTTSTTTTAAVVAARRPTTSQPLPLSSSPSAMLPRPYDMITTKSPVPSPSFKSSPSLSISSSSKTTTTTPAATTADDAKAQVELVESHVGRKI
jgi:hypothetical protein